MQKVILDTFIKRYNLGDLIPKIKWRYTASTKTLHARAAADNKSFIADVILHNFDAFGVNDVVICIGDTSKLKKMLATFDDEVVVEINKVGDKVLGTNISNADIECYYAFADVSAIDPAPKSLDNLPDSHIEIPLTEEFVDAFQKARMALKDVDSFSVGMNKKGKFEVVLGYTTSNSSRIRITPATDPIKNKMDTGLSFPANNILEVLRANSDIKDGVMGINNQGIMKLFFKNDDYTCTFYQFANKKA